MTHYQRSFGWCLLALLASAGAAQAQTQEGKVVPKDTATIFQVYGFVQGDGIFEFGTSDPNWFDVNRPTKLPAFPGQFGGDNHFAVSARQTRFGVKTSLPAGNTLFKTAFEFDMFGVGVDAGQTTIRLRLAYGQWGQFGAGQLWSPFMDVDVFPNILDYWGPNGMLFFRNTMVFWQPIEKENGTRLTFALERPGASGDQGLFKDRVELQNITPRFPWPDLSGSYRYADKWGYAKLGGIVRSIRWDNAAPDTFHLAGGATGWGVSLSGGINAGKHDLIHLQGIYGKGVQNYFNDAPVDVGIQRNLTEPFEPLIRGVALPIYGVVAFLDHTWNKTYTSSIGYSRVQIDNSSGQANSDFHSGDYGTINLLSTPAPNVMIGGEFQWGRRTNFNDGFSVNDYRLEFSFKYSYSKTWGGDK
jgi:DcaP outer membrane protein